MIRTAIHSEHSASTLAKCCLSMSLVLHAITLIFAREQANGDGVRISRERERDRVRGGGGGGRGGEIERQKDVNAYICVRAGVRA